MEHPRTTKIIDKTGCIEDRTFDGAENGELNQTPGADIYFSVAKDVMAVVEKGSPTNNTLNETIEADVARLGGAYTVHNDAGHGEKFDGCGFAGRIDEIFADVSQNVDEIIDGLQLDKEQVARAHVLAGAAGKLAVHESYFSVKGGQLVENAVNAGASLVTYNGAHTAGSLTIDDQEGRSYNSADANSSETDSVPGFNVDTNYAASRAEEFDLDPRDAKLLSKLISLATVRVLSDKTITKAKYV